MAGDRKILWIIATLFAAGAMTGTALADSDQNQARGEQQTKQLLLVMDKDQNGKVSKQEFMNFMAAEFNRLDTNKDGELDVDELTKLQVRRVSGPHK